MYRVEKQIPRNLRHAVQKAIPKKDGGSELPKDS